MTKVRQAELIVDPGSRIIQPAGAALNALGSDHVGVHHVGVSPKNQPNVRYMYHGLIVGPCVHVAPYTETEEFVFIREQRPPATTKGLETPAFLGFPGGFADNSGDAAAQATKELAQEAGITKFESLIPLRQGINVSDASYQPYPQLSDETSNEFLATGVVLPSQEEFDEVRMQDKEGTETHIELVTMSIPQIERILAGKEAAETPFAGPAISTLYMATLAIRNL